MGTSKDSYRNERNTASLQFWKSETSRDIKQIWRIYGYLYFKTKMGVSGLMFEPHPPNFEKLYNF